MNGGLLSAWIAELVLITYRGSVRGTTKGNPIPHLPVPAEYASSFIVFGALAFLPGEAQRVATVAGWGLVVATFLNLWNPGGLSSGATPAKTGTKKSTTTPSAATDKTPKNTPGFSPTPHR